MSFSSICIIKIDSYNPELIQTGLELAWKKLGLQRLFATDEKILIKPNLLSAVHQDQAVTAHPAVFEALINVLKNPDCCPDLILSYGDSPAYDPPLRAARAAGLQAIADKAGLLLADFENGRPISFPADNYVKSLTIANGVLESDGLISLCKFKTHALTGITGAVKNQYGVIPGLRKAKFHASYASLDSFTRMLVDLNNYVKPRLYVMDAVMSMEGNGPRNGRPRKTGYVLVGTDPVAIDYTMATLTGHQPDKMKLFEVLKELKAGCADPKLIQIGLVNPELRPAEDIVFTSLEAACRQLMIKDFVQAKTEHSMMTRATRLGGGFMQRYILNRPVISASKCVKCGRCVEACPVEPKALIQKNKGIPYYQYGRCIRCFCCQEICPAAAITVRKPWTSAAGRR